MPEPITFNANGAVISLKLIDELARYRTTDSHFEAHPAQIRSWYRALGVDPDFKGNSLCGHPLIVTENVPNDQLWLVTRDENRDPLVIGLITNLGEEVQPLKIEASDNIPCDGLLPDAPYDRVVSGQYLSPIEREFLRKLLGEAGNRNFKGISAPQLLRRLQ